MTPHPKDLWSPQEPTSHGPDVSMPKEWNWNNGELQHRKELVKSVYLVSPRVQGTIPKALELSQKRIPLPSGAPISFLKASCANIYPPSWETHPKAEGRLPALICPSHSQFSPNSRYPRAYMLGFPQGALEKKKKNNNPDAWAPPSEILI